MPTPERSRRRLLHRRVLAWYGEHRRELEWRRTTDPYEILVSEVMLQQTQVSRVRGKLPEFLRTYPTLRRLARATITLHDSLDALGRCLAHQGA